MFSKTFSTAAAVLAVAQLASAQTYTECNPTEKTCPADEAFGSTVDVDFTKGKNENFYEFDGTKIDYTDEGAVFTINKESDAPTIGTNKYIFFGKVDVTVQASFGQGVVTSFVLQSDDLDEIDWEWLGGDTTQVQTNYFGKGDTTTYDRGAYHDVANPQTSTHTYTVDWTKDYVRWSIDGTQVRELTYAEAKEGTRFPQTPMQIRLGTWVAGRADAPKGTVEWAGGYTDFSKAPFIAYYKEIKITDYSNGVDGASKYVWDDGSDGSYQSIQVVTGDDSDDDTSSTSAKPTSTTSAKPSSTAESSKTSSEASETTASATVSKTASATVTSASATATVSASASTTATSTGGESASETSGDSTSETDAAPSSTDIPQTAAAFKAGSSAIVMAAGLIAALF
ncbi:hypothetical protein MGN70_001428 [Eutypa lata]|uniref:Crh-like protein n=1 Tax=Eutypa lata (strain UCR-EL1) TaxID=1287681 RepID=M7SHI7_EUTLA|nr:putative glycoside hydrolase family 16 protein [Eutypa lata UCREL1]KAI1256304.1 hypothetical protein MGN70_001428 [Eutypa lata]